MDGLEIKCSKILMTAVSDIVSVQVSAEALKRCASSLPLFGEGKP